MNDRSPAYRTLFGCVSLGLAYYLGTLLGYALIFPGSYISIAWPPNLVLLVAVLVSPRRAPWFVLFAYPVHLAAQAQFGVPFGMASLYYLHNLAQVSATSFAYRRFGIADLELDDLRRAITFLVVTPVAVGLAALVWSPLFASLTTGGDLVEQWSLAMLSNLMPFLLAAPGLVAAIRHGPELLRRAPRARSLELAALSVGLLAFALIYVAVAARSIEALPTLFYTPLPFLLWAAVRFGPAGLSIAFTIFALTNMFTAIAGYGPFGPETPGNSVFHLQIFLVALFAPQLVLAAVVKERHTKAVALRQSESLYRGIVEDQTELICRFLPDGTYTFVNDAYCRYFGIRREAFLGGAVNRLPEQADEAARARVAAMSPASPVTEREQEVFRANGDRRWLHWRERGFFDDDGRPIEYQAVGHDVTARRRLDEATAGLAHGARLAVVGELTASIAHEMSQPAGAILANCEAAAELLKQGEPSLGSIEEIVADIQRDAERAREVIQKIRVLARRGEPTRRAIDLNELAAEVIELVGRDARRRRVTILTRFEPGRAAVVLGDRVHLQQVVLNLLLNAMDAMADTPETQRRITVATEAADHGAVTLSVSDRGHGIAPSALPKLFDSFYTTKAQGMGLGLAIARSIVEVHDGTLSASNLSEGGAKFRLTLPGLAAASQRTAG